MCKLCDNNSFGKGILVEIYATSRSDINWNPFGKKRGYCSCTLGTQKRQEDKLTEILTGHPVAVVTETHPFAACPCWSEARRAGKPFTGQCPCLRGTYRTLLNNKTKEKREAFSQRK